MWPFKRRRPQVYVPPPRSADAPFALAALQAVPGPSPWYIEGTTLPAPGGLLQWQSAGEEPAAVGKCLLRSSAGDVLAIADFNCYVRSLSASRMLVWYSEDDDVGPLLQRAMRFQVFDLGQLRPIDDLTQAYHALGPRRRFLAGVKEVGGLVLSAALGDGVHRVTLPECLQTAGELLVLVHSTSGGRRENHFDQMHLRLWSLDPAQGKLEIVPQDWFNEGAYDFGYQWVTRLSRLTATGAIVGEGIRLGVFKLDATNRRVAEWLVEDNFYYPERSPTAAIQKEP